MNVVNSRRFLARVTLEFTTPFHIGAGTAGIVSDAMVAADANGLPAIPGSSLAGVIRSAFRKQHPESEKRMFGYQLPGPNGGCGSRVSVSWGCIHDSENRPLEGLVKPNRLEDPVLLNALDSVQSEVHLRDHVRIGRRGAADGGGKFDESYVCAGHRFTFEIEMCGEPGDEDKKAWDCLIGLLRDPSLRLGGKSRRGFGAFKIVSIRTGIFDLARDWEKYRYHPVSLSEASPALVELQPTADARAMDTVTATLELEPEGYWMFGKGEDAADIARPADMAPVRDTVIVWTNDRAAIKLDVLLIPGSAVKGALSHRVAFHYNALIGAFADRTDTDPEAKTGDSNEAVRQLFGYALNARAGDAAKGQDAGRRGRVMINDVFVLADPPPSQLIPHVSLDRFTGGARTLSGALFSERPLWKGKLPPLSVAVDKSAEISEKAKKALNLALLDLAEGRLQVGGGSGRGLGYFRAPKGVQWSEQGWVKGDKP